MNLRLLSSNKAEITESNTFCTQAPYSTKQKPRNQSLTQTKIKSVRKAKIVIWEYSNGVVSANVVLIDSLKPTNIVVRVRDQVDIDLIWDDPVRGVVGYERGF